MSVGKIERRLAAILAADVVGYSRLMGDDEAGTLAQLRAHRRNLIDPQIAEHRGRVVKTTGDGLLVEFVSVIDALNCATEWQAAVPGDSAITWRIGINVGDVVVEDGDIFGDGVNVAARLEGLGDPGGICVSARVREDAEGKLDIAFEDMGEQRLKNIARPVRVYRVAGLRPFRSPGVETAVMRREAVLSLPDKPSIAVLPFQNMSGDPEQEYFADGMVEDIITALSQFKSLLVIARNSSFTFKGKAIDIKEVGRELGVRYVLEGSVRKSGGRIRITGQLIDVTTGAHLWADKFDGLAEDVFELQDQVTASVVGAIEPNLLRAETDRVRSKLTNSLSAYDHYLLARALSDTWTRSGFEQAKGHICQAVALDPDYSLAKASGSLIVMRGSTQSWATEEDVRLGITWAREAISADRGDPITLRSAGIPIALLGRDFDLALYAVKRAVAICPHSATVLVASGWVHSYIGETATAEAHLREAMRLSPLDPEKVSFLSALANAYIVATDYESALQYALKAAPEQQSAMPLRFGVVALANLGRIEEAREMGRRLIALSPDYRISKVPIPARDQEACERFVHGLRLGGLPE